MIYNIGQLQINTDTSEVRVNNIIVELRKSARDTLLYLIENQGKICSPEDILETVWKGKNVEENNVNQAISLINNLNGLDNKIIENIPKEGYLIKSNPNNNHTENNKNSKSQVFSDMNKINWDIQPGFHWYIICGVSSSGKDVAAGMSFKRIKEKNIPIIKHSKVLTRNLRADEDGLRHETDENFNKLLEEGRLCLSYKKGSYRVALDSEQIKEAAFLGKPLLTVFTGFDKIPSLIDFFESNNIPITVFYIDVPMEELIERTRYRNLDRSVVEEKQDNIPSEIESALSVKGLTNKYISLSNGNKSPLHNLIVTIVETISSNYKKETPKK